MFIDIFEAVELCKIWWLRLKQTINDCKTKPYNYTSKNKQNETIF